MASFADAIAPENVAPHAWQTAAPQELFQSRGMPVQDSDDLERVLALPRREPLDLKSVRAEAMVEYEMAKYAKPNSSCKCATIDRQIALGKRTCITRFLPMQAWMLHEIGIVRGLIAQASVGAGKTVCNILAPLAMGLKENESALLLVPPTLVEQTEIDYRLIAQHFRVPALMVRKAGQDDKPYQVAGAPTLYVVGYSMISQTENSDIFEEISPSLIIADECDALKDRTAARTMRFLRYFSGTDKMTKAERRARLSSTRLCAWTGSITDSRIEEYQHLALLALREKSPLPLSREVTEEWGRCLNANATSPAGRLLERMVETVDPVLGPLCRPGESVRTGFHRRLRETMGFVIANAGRVIVEGSEDKREVELDIREKEAPPLPPRVAEALAKVRKGTRPDSMFGSPDDETLVDALAIAKCAQEVACGMFYRWKFPPIKGVLQKRETIEEWYKARKLWNSELRDMLMRGEEFLDTPKLCENAARRAYGEMERDPRRPVWKSDAWPRWRDIMDKVVWEPEACRIDPFLAQDAADWGNENRGIIWYGMTEFAEWVWELSGPPGKRLTLHRGGPKAGELLRNESGERSIIASIKSHGRGRNGLQYIFNHQLVAQTPASASAYEQLLGRLDRKGQREDRVITEIYLHTREVKKAFQAALRKGQYVRETLGENQKLLVGWGEPDDVGE